MSIGGAVAHFGTDPFYLENRGNIVAGASSQIAFFPMLDATGAYGTLGNTTPALAVVAQTGAAGAAGMEVLVGQAIPYYGSTLGSVLTIDGNGINNQFLDLSSGNGLPLTLKGSDGAVPTMELLNPSGTAAVFLSVSSAVDGAPATITLVGEGASGNAGLNVVTQGSGTVTVNGVPIGTGFANPMTTAGDLIYGAGSGTAISITQDTAAGSGASGTSQILTVTATGASKLLVCSIVMELHSTVLARTVTSMSDNQGNTWQKAVNGTPPTTGRNGAEIWYVKANATAGVTSVTANFSGTCSSTMRFYEIAGIVTGASLDQTASNYGVGASESTLGMGQTAQANEIAIAVLTTTGISATYKNFTTGFTNDSQLQNNVSNFAQTEQAAHQILTAVTTGLGYGASTSGSANDWAGAIATFKGSATIPGTAARLGIGTTGQVLTVASGIPAWAPTSVSAITSGALPTQVFSTGVGAQVLTTREVKVVVPVTYTPTAGANATCTLALSPDNITYSTLVTTTVPLGTALDSFVEPMSFTLPAGWYAKLTVNAQATLGTATYY